MVLVVSMGPQEHQAPLEQVVLQEPLGQLVLLVHQVLQPHLVQMVLEERLEHQDLQEPQDLVVRQVLTELEVLVELQVHLVVLVLLGLVAQQVLVVQADSMDLLVRLV